MLSQAQTKNCKPQIFNMPDKNFPLSGFSSLAIYAGHTQSPNYTQLSPVYASSTYVSNKALPPLGVENIQDILMDLEQVLQ